MSSLHDALLEDTKRAEDLCIKLGEEARAAGKQNKLYWIALALYHVLQWILRKEKRNGQT